MRINDYAEVSSMKESDNVLIDTASGTYRATIQTVKDFIGDPAPPQTEDTTGDIEALIGVKDDERVKVKISNLPETLSDIYPDTLQGIERLKKTNILISDESIDGGYKKLSFEELIKIVSYMIHHPWSSDLKETTENDLKVLGLDGNDDLVRYDLSSVLDNIPNYLFPAGSVLFQNLPAISTVKVGATYNVLDNFTTTTEFREGSGKTYLGGTNVYKSEDGKWDCLSGPGVVGIKGTRSSTYRQGNVTMSIDDFIDIQPARGDKIYIDRNSSLLGNDPDNDDTYLTRPFSDVLRSISKYFVMGDVNGGTFNANNGILGISSKDGLFYSTLSALSTALGVASIGFGTNVTTTTHTTITTSKTKVGNLFDIVPETAVAACFYVNINGVVEVDSSAGDFGILLGPCPNYVMFFWHKSMKDVAINKYFLVANFTDTRIGGELSLNCSTGDITGKANTLAHIATFIVRGLSGFYIEGR